MQYFEITWRACSYLQHYGKYMNVKEKPSWICWHNVSEAKWWRDLSQHSWKWSVKCMARLHTDIMHAHTFTQCIPHALHIMHPHIHYIHHTHTHTPCAHAFHTHILSTHVLHTQLHIHTTHVPHIQTYAHTHTHAHTSIEYNSVPFSSVPVNKDSLNCWTWNTSVSR